MPSNKPSLSVGVDPLSHVHSWLVSDYGWFDDDSRQFVDVFCRLIGDGIAFC